MMASGRPKLLSAAKAAGGLIALTAAVSLSLELRLPRYQARSLTIAHLITIRTRDQRARIRL
jgi:hypothetical protein